MFLKCPWLYFIAPLLYVHYIDKSYDSNDDIPISQLVLKRKAKVGEEEESLDDEQEEDEESNLKTNEAIGREEEEDESSSDGNDRGLCSLCSTIITLRFCYVLIMF